MLHTEARESTSELHRSPAVILAAACMASAGLVHAAAAGSHNEHGLMATMFAMTALVQLGWAAIALIKPSRLVYAAGAVIAFGAIGVWTISRVWGIGFVEGLVGPQAVGFQDAVATVLQLFAGVALLSALWRPVTNGRTVVLTRVAVVMGALALIAAVPASAAPHSEHNHTTFAGGEHDDHGDGHGGDHGEGHDDDHRDIVIDGYAYHADVTDEQVAAAEALIEDTRAALAETEYWDYDAAIEAGYASIGDQVTGYEHLVNVEYIANDDILNPNQIESLVYMVQPNGTRVLASAMYLMPFGTTMDDIPDIAGDITEWHDHQNLCWDENNPVRVVGTTNDEGECERGVFRATQAMLHVWLLDHRCGPFAGIETGGHGEGCDHEH